MDAHQAQLSGFPLRSVKDRALHPHSPSQVNDIFDDSLGYLHPAIQQASPPQTGRMPIWEAQRMQQYLNDDQIAVPLFLADTSSLPSTTTTTTTTTTPPRILYRRALGVPIAPAPPRPGVASPLSSIDPLTGASSALSPAADTESCYDNFPVTPPDSAALLSPFTHPTPLEWPRDSANFFSNMGPVSNDACINPAVINPSPNLGFVPQDGSGLDFDLGFDGCPTQCDTELPHNHAIESRSMSMFEEEPPMVEEGMETTRYPSLSPPAPLPPPAQDADDEDDDGDDEEEDYDNASDQVADAPTTKKRTVSEDDADYVPGKKLKTNLGASPRKTRPKPAAPSTRPAKAPLKKKAKAATSTPQSQIYPTPSRPAAKGSFGCKECGHASFKDENSLQNHIKKQHRQPFICVFHFAGCTSIFPNKNEWKRHVDTQHILSKYWHCQEGECGKSSSSSSSSSHKGSSKPAKSRGGEAAGGKIIHLPGSGAPGSTSKIFRRKDLFTQHVRRMHAPPGYNKSSSSPSKSSQHHQQQRKGGLSPAAAKAFDQKVAALQAQCERPRCLLPQFMLCPVAGCSGKFEGHNAWDLRMEHVAKHLEKAARGEEDPVEFGGESDTTLLEWASLPEVNVIRRNPQGKGWVYNDLEVGLVPCASATATSGAAPASVAAEADEADSEIVVSRPWDPEEDAEGEECFE